MGKIVVGILAHVDAGKTTLSEGMLYTSGAIRTMGRVDNRMPSFRYLCPRAGKRDHDLFKTGSVPTWDYAGNTVRHAWTCGFFSGNGTTLQVLDYAILVISGADGVQGHTRTLWNLLRRYEIPTFVFTQISEGNGCRGAFAGVKERLRGRLRGFFYKKRCAFL